MAIGGYFTGPDYAIFLLAIIISLLIGLYQMFKRRKDTSFTATELLTAGRKMRIIPVSLSMTATMVSAILILGVPGEVVKYGSVYSLTGISIITNFIFCAHCVVPVFHRLRLYSSYQYLELRFHKSIRLLASLTFTIQTLFYMSIVIYAMSMAVSFLAGIPPWVAITVSGALCTMYTAIGGFRAVIWTDVFQMIVILSSLIVMNIIGVQKVGGTSRVANLITQGDRWPYFLFDPDPRILYSVWSTVLGSTFTGIASFSFNQMIIQRFVSLPKKKHAIASIYAALPVALLMTTLLTITGLVIYANYANCAPDEDYSKLLPKFVIETLGVFQGMTGVFVSCIFCGALSTISSGINSLAAVMYYDFVMPLWSNLFKTPHSDSSSGKVTVIISLILGALSIAFAFIVSLYNSTTILQTTLRVMQAISGPIAGMFILGLFIPFSNSIGALVGFITASIMTIWMIIGSAVTHAQLKQPLLTGNNSTNSCLPIPTVDRTLYKNQTGLNGFYVISYLWYAFFAVFLVLILGSVVSLATGRTTSSKRKYTLWRYRTIPMPPLRIEP